MELKSSNRAFFTALAILLAFTTGAIALILKNGTVSTSNRVGRVAVLDTGVNPEGLFPGARVRASVERDWEGSGTRAAAWILRECPSCEILGYQVRKPKELEGVLPTAFALKIREAMFANVDVILLSALTQIKPFLVSELAPLKEAVTQAYNRGIIIVVPSGDELRPIDSSWMGALWPKCVIVGAMVSWFSTNESMGYGRSLDWVVAQMGIPTGEQGTIPAAAWVAGLAGEYKAQNPEGHTEDFRAELTHSHLIAHQKLPEPLRLASPEKIGRGVLELSTRGSK